MKHLGDITKLSGYTAPVVNVVIGGSPCQDLSVAGKRAGFDGERSVLFLDQIRIIKEMREKDERDGRTGVDVRPRFMVWENVPGAFSSKSGEDFRCVLEETARVKAPDAVIPGLAKWKNGTLGRWRNAGVILGDGWSIAWRVFDAQFWGVPQRRRRIALVADFGGHAAPEILFERSGLSGDPETGRTEREGAAGDAACGFGETGIGWWRDGIQTLRTAERPGAPVNVVCLNDQGGDVMGVSADISGTLRAEEHGHQPAVCIQGNCIDRADTAGCNGKGWRDDDVSYTLNTIDRPAVFAIENHPADSRVKIAKDGVVQTLSSRMGTGGGNVPMCVGTENPEIAGTLDASYYKGTGARNGKERTVVYAVDCRNGEENPETNGTLQAKSNGGQSLNLQNVVRTYQTVRRLTPLECERLQGYPDYWTDIGEWVDSKGKKHISSDSARYKALGNSIALPPWRYVLGRLYPYCREKTMASLFDGIGGFPLIWNELGGVTVWASEIEEFPIAVTKRRFGE